MWPQLLSPCLDCSLEAQPKYVKGGKRYGRRSLPEFQESVEEFAEIEPLDEEARPSHAPASDRGEVRNWMDTPIWTRGVETHTCPQVWGRDRRTQGFMAFLSYQLLANLTTCLWGYIWLIFLLFECFPLCFSFRRADIFVQALC